MKKLNLIKATGGTKYQKILRRKMESCADVLQ